MEFMQEEVRGYSDREEDQEEEEDIIREESSNKQQQYPFPSPSLSSSLANYRSQQNQWLGRLHDHHHSPEATTTTESHNSSSGLGLQLHPNDAAAINFTNRKLEDFMELSLGNKDDEANFHGGGCSGGGGGSHRGTSSTGNNDSNNDPIQKEHMFDKVVTPSDVGKLNRLVIPKQHAEKYFPLDSSGNEKGLLLNFEDRNGKLWRFRYSYWNSSQSYVMTKGWSRFVKEKKLDAGDIVSFQRGVGESFRHRLYIDWRRRPDHAIHDPASALITPFLLQNQPHLSQYSIRWGGRLYSVPSPAARHHAHLQQMNYNNMYPFYPQNHHHHQHHCLQQQQQYHQYHNYNYNELNPGSGSLYYSRSAAPPSMADHQSLQGRLQEGGNSPMIIDSVPVIAHNHGKSSSNATNTASKRLRLFGVNMECASSSEEQKNSAANVTMAANSLPSSSSLPLLHLRAAHEDHSISSSFNNQAGFSEKVRTSMFFDLDPSLQYRQ